MGVNKIKEMLSISYSEKSLKRNIQSRRKIKWSKKELWILGTMATVIAVSLSILGIYGAVVPQSHKSSTYKVTSTRTKSNTAKTFNSSVSDAKNSGTSIKKSTNPTSTVTTSSSTPYNIGISYGDTLAWETTSQLDSTFADA